MTNGTFPGFLDVAANVAAIAELLPGSDNRHRQALRSVVGALRQPVPDMADVGRRTMVALFDLVEGDSMVDKPETWLLSAVLVCLAGQKGHLAQAATAAAKEWTLQ